MTQKKISAYAIPGLKNRYRYLTGEEFVKLLKLVAERYKVDYDDILEYNRTAPLPYIRMLMISYIRRNYSQITVVNLGKMMNGRDHTTMIHSTQQFQNKLDTDEPINKKLKSEYATVREDYLHTSKYLNSCLL